MKGKINLICEDCASNILNLYMKNYFGESYDVQCKLFIIYIYIYMLSHFIIYENIYGQNRHTPLFSLYYMNNICSRILYVYMTYIYIVSTDRLFLSTYIRLSIYKQIAIDLLYLMKMAILWYNLIFKCHNILIIVCFHKSLYTYPHDIFLHVLIHHL